ncbi:hypothetical protein DSO57_1025603 [Entomophthora muscae]|uniref:Uncharacterized protein n=1 Tax=Entomophthora muscae TaxID=34485 RepID=A0ACC2SRU1_9FUNG|nr:hypothetical protein DSO57_1025603 [Entomophthora muscae]
MDRLEDFEQTNVALCQEKALVKKLDRRIIPYVCVLYTLCFLDRVNIGHARLYNIEKDLNLDQDQYSWALSVFFIGYILFEVPSNLLLKRFSPPRWIARIMVSWGIVTLAMAAVTDFKGILVARFFLGAAEAGLFPGIIFFLSFWFTRQEQGIRIALLSASSQLAGAFGGLIAYSVKALEGRWGLKGWQWLFFVEGVVTVVMGIITWWALPATPNDAPWLSSDERHLLRQRLQSSHVDLDIGRFRMQEFISAFTDYKTYLYVMIFVGLECPLYAMMLLMPTIVNSFGFSTFNSMLLSSPPNLFALVMTLAVAWNSDRVLERGYHIMFSTGVAIAGFITLTLTQSIAIKYTALILIMGGLAASFPPNLSWSNNNMVGSTKAATCSALIIALGNAGGFASAHLYRKEEAPDYTRSHLINTASLCVTLISVILLKVGLTYENHKRDKLNPAAANTFRYIL